MGQSPEELRQDIDRTREDLGDTLEAIGDRVSPGRIVERRTRRVRGALSSVRESVMGVAQGADDRPVNELDANGWYWLCVGTARQAA